MNLVNEMADLVNRLSSIAHDSRNGKDYGGILGINIDERRTVIHMYHKYFVDAFKIYDVVFVEMRMGYPYMLETEIDGVVFQALMSAKDIVELKNTNERHFYYIQEQLQSEAS